MSRYPRPVRLPTNAGDSVEFHEVTCSHCLTKMTIAVEWIHRGRDRIIKANVPVCCAVVANRHRETEAEIEKTYAPPK